VPYSDKQADWLFPPELQNRIREAMVPVASMHRKRMITPVPGNPSGGFPGINHAQMKQEIINTRKAVIDKWNKENPNG
jgi:hypothetical protein